MTPEKFLDTIKEAHGCELPSFGCLFVEQTADRYIYDCWLFDYDVTISVPMPKEALIFMLYYEHLELDDYRVRKLRCVEVFLYALAKYDKQPQKVQQYLKGRFGPLLQTMREHATTRWQANENLTREMWYRPGGRNGS